MNVWSLLFAALGLAMLLEGLPYFISPRGVRAYMAQLEKMRDGTLRALGLAMMAVGLLIAYLSLH